jgi:hypothetical protein
VENETLSPSNQFQAQALELPEIGGIAGYQNQVLGGRHGGNLPIRPGRRQAQTRQTGTLAPQPKAAAGVKRQEDEAIQDALQPTPQRIAAR